MSTSARPHDDQEGLSQGSPEALTPSATRQAREQPFDEDDDDDMDYEPPSENDEEEDEADEDGTEYHDADDGLGRTALVFSPEQGDETQTGAVPQETEDTERSHLPHFSRQELLDLFSSHGGLSRYVVEILVRTGQGSRAEDQDVVGDHLGLRTRRRLRGRRQDGPNYPKIPSDEGTELMNSGVFGSPDPSQGSKIARRSKLASRLLDRELGLTQGSRTKNTNRLIAQTMIPSSPADFVVDYDSKCYSGQFSEDGNFFFSCSQDFRVRMYDTSNPYRWKYYKSVIYPGGQWTITDASLSPDNRFLAYSSIRSIVCLAPTDPDADNEPYLLDFAKSRTRRGTRNAYGDFGIWSVRFSGDGREIVAGAQDDSVYVYDLETRQSILRISGHKDDVNAVCYGDKMSPHILYSGSDDTTLKVWDRRSMGDGREAGVFLGHREGLTYVDSKGDGRYVLSNSKDQTMKLWDLRKMMSTDRFDEIDTTQYTTQFDYRFSDYDPLDYQPHPEDCSLVTFRGHRVLKTLIRCHFAPPQGSDSRYVYSGSQDGSVYIYNLDATLAGKVNVSSATRGCQSERRARNSRDEDYVDFEFQRPTNGGCVRDASWHPYAPIIAATSWTDWGMGTGTCSLHSWNDDADEDEGQPRMGIRLNDKLEHLVERTTTSRSPPYDI